MMVVMSSTRKKISSILFIEEVLSKGLLSPALEFRSVVQSGTPDV